jgi:hypothetical protein
MKKSEESFKPIDLLKSKNECEFISYELKYGHQAYLKNINDIEKVEIKFKKANDGAESSFMKVKNEQKFFIHEYSLLKIKYTTIISDRTISLVYCD